MKKFVSALLLLAVTAPFFQTGCEHSSRSSSEQPKAEAEDGSDEVDFSLLNFDFGGVDGSAAQAGGVTISSLRAAGLSMAFAYITNLRAWGVTDDNDAPALSCFFVKRNDGRWVGGKFDWIGSSRNTRPLDNVVEHYQGWSLDNVPNPCECAFLILTADGSRRSNVIAGTWDRSTESAGTGTATYTPGQTPVVIN